MAVSDDRRVATALRFALVGFGLVVLVALAWTASTSTAAYDPYNPGEDGTSDLRAHLESEPGVAYEPLTDGDGYADLESNATAVIVVPSESAALTEPDGVTQYVRDGGTLVLLGDDDAASNTVLEAAGADARLEEGVIRDDRHHYRGPAMPVATNVSEHALTDGVDRLGLFHATAVEPNGATVIATTSEHSYLVDRPDAAREDEVPMAHPVATVEDVGDGRVIVVGDSALATNEMIDRPDNAQFVANGYAEADADRVVIDAAADAERPPLADVRSVLGEYL